MEYSYKFSIIIALYNSENYIKDTLDSVINQSFGFKNNVEIIIVDDGSTDSSSVICKKYVEKYPNNIKYIYKRNGGVASARNLGLKYAKGQYFNFLDSDDLLSPKTLEVVYNFFEKNKNEIDMVTLPIEHFEGRDGLHHRYVNVGNASHVINLKENPLSYFFSVSASFYKQKVFKNEKFDTNLKIAEDLLFNTKLFLNNPKFGLISPVDAVYYYRKRFVKNSITDTIEYDINWLVNVFEQLNKNIIKLIKKKKNVPEFIQNIIIYNIEFRIKMPYFVSTEILKKFFSTAEKMLSYVDENTIMKYPFKDYYSLAMLLMIKHKEYNLKKCVCIDSKNNLCLKGKVIENIENYSCKIINVKIENNELLLEGFFNDIIEDNFKMHRLFNDNYYEIKVEKTSNSFLQKRFFDKIIGQAYKLKIAISLGNEGNHSISLSLHEKHIPISLTNAYNEEPFMYKLTTQLDNKNINITINNQSIIIK